MIQTTHATKAPDQPTEEILQSIAKKMRVRRDTPNTKLWYFAVLKSLRELGYVKI